MAENKEDIAGLDAEMDGKAGVNDANTFNNVNVFNSPNNINRYEDSSVTIRHKAHPGILFDIIGKTSANLNLDLYNRMNITLGSADHPSYNLLDNRNTKVNHSNKTTVEENKIIFPSGVSLNKSNESNKFVVNNAYIILENIYIVDINVSTDGISEKGLFRPAILAGGGYIINAYEINYNNTIFANMHFAGTTSYDGGVRFYADSNVGATDLYFRIILIDK